MKKVMFLLTVIISMHLSCMAIDNADEFLSLVKMDQKTVTQDKVMAMFGKPTRVEESRKGAKWYYSNTTTDLTIDWNATSGIMQKFSFTHKTAAPCAFDVALEHKLKSGVLDISNAVKLLGAPKDMIMKSATQVMHYSYQGNILRLFFRNRTLVDYTLVQQRARN